MRQRVSLRGLIRRRMARLKWSLSDLARATGQQRQNLGPVLRGERPLRVKLLLLIDCALNLGLDYNGCSWADPDPTARGRASGTPTPSSSTR